MVYWIQGNDNKKRFKCLVIHYGVISTIIIILWNWKFWFPMAECFEKDNTGLKLMKEMNKEKDKINIILKNMFKICQHLI